MADVTISSLTNRQPNSSAVFPYSEGGTTYNASLNQVIPTGVIVMWSGSIATIPSGWALCNGSNGTPDLRNQFIIGASVDVDGQSQTGITGANTKTGGTKDAIVISHTHTVTDPGHTHSYDMGGGNGTVGVYEYFGSTPYNASLSTGDIKNASTGITIQSTGSSGTNANLPPYYALAYIMKL